MKFLKVNLWGKEIGRLGWDPSTRRTFFVYNSKTKDRIPDISPLLFPTAKRDLLLPIYGDDLPVYQGLPPFIADSLPDSWGNTLFDKWIRENHVPRNKVTPLYKLMFIGKRGMGALEYEPAATDLSHCRQVVIKDLYDMSLRVSDERASIKITPDEQLTLQALLAVGTSAGGRQMKAIIAINNETGEIRSGQTDGMDGFDYYILKFGDKSMPVSEIEATYFEMARKSGIVMEDCRLLPIEGINHFLTQRFDRKNGKKIHIQTLAAINPYARSYEDLIATCRELLIPESEIEQLYRRMVFNVMANNTDDHNKNFSFMLEEGDRWKIAPVYDVTFIFNTTGTGPNIARRLSICGKISDISKDDLLEFARQNDIRNPKEIIDSIAETLAHFEEFTADKNIPQRWKGIIKKTITDSLANFGYAGRDSELNNSFVDSFGRLIDNFSITINSKGIYEISVTTGGSHRRRFVRKGMTIYEELAALDIFQLPLAMKQSLIERLFPPE